MLAIYRLRLTALTASSWVQAYVDNYLRTRSRLWALESRHVGNEKRTKQDVKNTSSSHSNMQSQLKLRRPHEQKTSVRVFRRLLVLALASGVLPLLAVTL